MALAHFNNITARLFRKTRTQFQRRRRETMALKQLVISTFVAGIPELVTEGDQGWLVPAGDVEALAKAIQSCLETAPEILEKMGRSAFDKVIISHNVDKEAAKLAALFDASLASVSS